MYFHTAIAGNLMRRILVDQHPRQARRETAPNPLEEAPIFCEDQSEELIELDRALTQFAKEYPRASQIVEMRFFGGMHVEEIAGVLKISPKTVKRDWSVARAWLHREFRPFGMAHGPQNLRALEHEEARLAAEDKKRILQQTVQRLKSIAPKFGESDQE